MRPGASRPLSARGRRRRLRHGREAGSPGEQTVVPGRYIPSDRWRLQYEARCAEPGASMVRERMVGCEAGGLLDERIKTLLRLERTGAQIALGYACALPI
jgi:hypothetical protein